MCCNIRGASIFRTGRRPSVASDDGDTLSLVDARGKCDRSRRHVISCVLRGRSRTPHLATTRLSQTTTASRTAISHFYHGLNFNDFHDFRFSLTHSLRDRHGRNLASRISLSGVRRDLGGVLTTGIDRLGTAVSNVSRRALTTIIRTLGGTNIVRFTTINGAGTITLSTAFGFSRLNLHYVTDAVDRATVNFTLALGPNSIVILVSGSNGSHHLGHVTETTHRTNTAMIIVDNSDGSPLTHLTSCAFGAIGRRTLLAANSFTFSGVDTAVVVRIVCGFLLPRVRSTHRRVDCCRRLVRPSGIIRWGT